MREIKFSCMWSDGKSWMDLRYTLEQLENGEHFDAMSDQPLLRKFALKSRRQYTGLKDKNGVEIYEGDIVTAKTCKGDGVEKLLGNVIFEDAEYLVEQNNGFFPLCSFCVIDRLSFKVIGNIYENPELLEKS